MVVVCNGFIVLMALLVSAAQWSPEDAHPPVAATVLGWLIIATPIVILFRFIRRWRRRRRHRTIAAHGDPALLPQRIAACRDPIMAVQAEATRAGGGSFIGFAGEGEWVGADPQHALLVLGPPRSGKTSAIIVPAVIAHPGAVVSTSTKPEVAAITAGLRARHGEVWLFDATGTEELRGVRALHWSPVRASSTWDGALVMAGPWWPPRPPAGGALPRRPTGAGGRWPCWPRCCTPPPWRRRP